MAKVPEVVMGEPVTAKNAGTVAATEVTVPEPPPVALIVWFGHVPLTVTLVPATIAGVAVPVPPLAIGRVPLTSAVNDTAPKVGAPAALPCKTVVVVPKLPSTVGATPAPPPSTILFVVNTPEEAQVVPLEKYGMPPLVPAIVNAGVVVGVATDTIPPVQLTDVTVPTNASLLVIVKLG